MSVVCLNCNEPLQGNFCIHCGQSAKTHRFTLKHIFTHDFLERLFHLDKGIFFSIRELLTRPGHSTRDYINGKRITRVNHFSLLIILILIFSLLEHVTPFHFTDLTDGEKEIFEAMDVMLKDHPKIIFIGILPLYALTSYIFFRKANQNYAENIVINSFRISVIVLFNMIFIAFASLVKDVSLIRKADTVLGWIGTGYGTWFYYQYFSPFYSNKFLLAVKSLLCTIVPVLLLTIVILFYFWMTGN